MPPSQLKQLKASLREHGVLGPQKSKKEKKRAIGRGDSEKRLARQDALQGIRERFNPFEVKAPARKAKFDVTSSKTINGITTKARPGIQKALGEQRRKETLLTELHRRNKIGGVLDRRFGEDDASLTPEQRAAERYARESERRLKKSSMFNLEDDDEEFQLTHGGQSISFEDEAEQDDFDETDLKGSSGEESADENGDGPRKRRRMLEMDGEEGEEEGSDAEDDPDRPKTKKEVMEEVIAKSKMYRHERQQAKEEDDDLRRELDKGLPEFFELMRQQKRPPPPTPASAANENPTAMMNPDRAAMLLGKDRKTAEMEYNERVREMAMDLRSKPADRTKTDEERLADEATRLRELETQRLKRMQGDMDDEEEETDAVEHPDDDVFDDAEEFGLAQDLDGSPRELGVEDEDDFVIDDDLVASDPDADFSFSEAEGSESEDEEPVEDDDEFINGLTLPAEKGTKVLTLDIPSTGNLAFTYPCPSTHEEFLEITKKVEAKDLPVVVQRIRALYHPKLDANNRGKLEVFSKVLVEHVVYLGKEPGRAPSTVIENLLRHIHSMAKSYPLPVGLAFREQLTAISEDRPLSLESSDLILLTGVMHIFPTSDHFHSVVTPSILTITRYLSQSQVSSLSDLAKGIYCVTLALGYQRLSKRYIPEVMHYLLNSLCSLAAVEFKDQSTIIPYRAPSVSLRMQKVASKDSTTTSNDTTPLKFWSLLSSSSTTSDEETIKSQLFSTCLSLLTTAASLWSHASAFPEIISPACTILDHLLSKPCTRHLSTSLIKQTQTTFTTLQGHLQTSLSARQPLELHHHRPLAIKQAIPKFETDFNPDRHYDPDPSRAEISKLKAEHKREKKGAMRELRKDSNFIARESLREKKERDAAYEKKYRRLIAEIQSEEGQASNAYDREKRKRQGKR